MTDASRDWIHKLTKSVGQECLVTTEYSREKIKRRPSRCAKARVEGGVKKLALDLCEESANEGNQAEEGGLHTGRDGSIGVRGGSGGVGCGGVEVGRAVGVSRSRGVSSVRDDKRGATARNGTRSRGRDGGRTSGGNEGELLGLREDGVEVIRVRNQVDLEARARGPSSRRRVDLDSASRCLNEGVQDLRVGRELGHVDEHDGEVGRISADCVPGHRVLANGGETRSVGGRSDRNGQSRGREGEEGSDDTHCRDCGGGERR